MAAKAAKVCRDRLLLSTYELGFAVTSWSCWGKTVTSPRESEIETRWRCTFSFCFPFPYSIVQVGQSQYLKVSSNLSTIACLTTTDAVRISSDCCGGPADGSRQQGHHSSSWHRHSIFSISIMVHHLEVSGKDIFEQHSTCNWECPAMPAKTGFDQNHAGCFDRPCVVFTAQSPSKFQVACTVQSSSLQWFTVFNDSTSEAFHMVNKKWHNATKCYVLTMIERKKKKQFEKQRESFLFLKILWRSRMAKHQSFQKTKGMWGCVSDEICTTKWLIPKTIGNRKRDCAWGCAWGINTTWENLQIEKHKSVRWAERTPSWFVLFDLQIFSGGIYSPSATSRTISFSISNSFWY